MGGVAVNLHVEDVSATGDVVIGSLDLCLMPCRALVVDRYVVGIGVVVAVGNSWDNAELLAVFLGELTAEALGWCG